MSFFCTSRTWGKQKQKFTQFCIKYVHSITLLNISLNFSYNGDGFFLNKTKFGVKDSSHWLPSDSDMGLMDVTFAHFWWYITSRSAYDRADFIMLSHRSVSCLKHWMRNLTSGHIVLMPNWPKSLIQPSKKKKTQDPECSMFGFVMLFRANHMVDVCWCSVLCVWWRLLL